MGPSVEPTMRRAPLPNVWFRPPPELIPAPACIVGFVKRPNRPQALKQETAAGAPPAAKRRTTTTTGARGAKSSLEENEEKDKSPPLEESLYGQVVGRCRVRLAATGEVLAAPHRLEDIPPHMPDEANELVVVEMRQPDGGVSWFEDRSLRYAIVERGIERAPARLDLDELRNLVKHRVSITGRTKQLAKALYKLCSPVQGSQWLVTLVPMDDLMAHVSELVSEPVSEPDPAPLASADA